MGSERGRELSYARSLFISLFFVRVLKQTRKPWLGYIMRPIEYFIQYVIHGSKYRYRCQETVFIACRERTRKRSQDTIYCRSRPFCCEGPAFAFCSASRQGRSRRYHLNITLYWMDEYQRLLCIGHFALNQLQDQILGCRGQSGTTIKSSRMRINNCCTIRAHPRHLFSLYTRSLSIL